MSQAVMISIRPKWCELIASGKKTVEVRKTAPKLPTPFKCYIYQTGEYVPAYVLSHFAGRRRPGCVIGEFICYNIRPVCAGYIHGACLEYEKVINYLGKNGHGCGWEISDLVIYDTPKELREFKRWNRTEENAPCAHVPSLYAPCSECKECNLTRPPQSYCFVEELA